jgi:hypothetical protein
LPHNVDSLKGFLLGLRTSSENTVIVNSAHSVRSDWKDLTDEYSKLQCCLPVGKVGNDTRMQIWHDSYFFSCLPFQLSNYKYKYLHFTLCSICLWLS